MNSKSLVFFILLSATSLLQAQDSVGSSMVKARIRLMGMGLDVTDVYFERSKKDVNFRVEDSSRSIFYKYEGPSQIVFYRLKPDDNGKIQHFPVAQAEIGSAGPMPLIFFFKDPSNPDGFLTTVTPDDVASFPAGTYKIINFSKLTVGGIIGGQEFRTAPNAIQFVKPTITSESPNVRADLYQVKNGTKIDIYGVTWGFNPALRTMVLLFNNVDMPDRVRVVRSPDGTDFPPEDPQEK